MNRPFGCLALVLTAMWTLLCAVAVSALVPWWAVLFGVVFWCLFARWRRLRATGVEPVQGGAVFSPFRGGGY